MKLTTQSEVLISSRVTGFSRLSIADDLELKVLAGRLQATKKSPTAEEGLRDCVGSATTTSHFPNPRLPYALEASKRFITRKFTSPATTPSNCPWLETGFLK